MPDFNDLADRLLTDMSTADWRDADLIRAAGNRRGRVELAVTAATIAVVAVVAVLLLANSTLLPGGNPGLGPAASRSGTPGPSVVANPTPSPAVTPSPADGPARRDTIPLGALLTPADLRPVFAGLGSPYAQPDFPNPFLGCGPDGLPGGQQFTGVVGAAFTGGGGSLVGGESVIRFQPGGAHLTMTAISQLMAGACAGPFQVLRRDLGGDESILVTSSDGSAVGPEAIHGVALYYAIERRGDYLVWVTLVDEARKTGQAGLAATLAIGAAQRACAAVTC
jgi:hypothetical protein